MTLMAVDPKEWDIILNVAQRVCTDREQHVLRYMAAGFGIRRTATQLECSYATVQDTRRRALNKVTRWLEKGTA